MELDVFMQEINTFLEKENEPIIEFEKINSDLSEVITDMMLVKFSCRLEGRLDIAIELEKLASVGCLNDLYMLINQCVNIKEIDIEVEVKGNDDKEE